MIKKQNVLIIIIVLLYCTCQRYYLLDSVYQLTNEHIPITVATQVNLLPKFWATCTLQSTQTQGVEKLMVCLDNFCACPVCRVFNTLAPANFQAENNQNWSMGQSKNWPARHLPQATKSECKLQSSITPAGRPGMLFSGCLT